MEKFVKVLNTEYDSTWGNLLVTIAITVIFTLVLQNIFETPIKKIIKWIKEKSAKVCQSFINKSWLKERFIYFKIIYSEWKRSDKNDRPLQSPPGIKFKDRRYYTEKIESGKSFAYPKLEKKFKWYRDTFPDRIDEYFEKNPDKKKEWEDIQDRLKVNVVDTNKMISDLINRL